MRVCHLPVPVAFMLTMLACTQPDAGGDQPPGSDPVPQAPAEPPKVAAPEPDEELEVADEKASPDDAVPDKSMAAEVMRGHFTEANNALDALVRADLDKAREAMAWLAGHDLGVAIPTELAPLLVSMQDAARTFGEAKTLREAGVAFATTLARCGECHRQASKAPAVASEPMPAGKDLPSHMARHHWAVRQLWAGLVTASAERFATGAVGLDETPLSSKVLGPLSTQPDKVTALDAHVHDLGKQIKAAQTDAERVTAYGHLLATCSTCHRLMGTGPKPVSATP